MTRYYRDYDYDYYDDNYLESPVEGLILFGLLYIVYKYYTDRIAFWHGVSYGIAMIVFLVFVYIIILILKNKRTHRIATEIKKINVDIARMVDDVKKEDLIKTSRSPTPQAQALHDALIARGIKCELEKGDGFKHIDIAIPWARMNIEIDGIQHYLDPKQVAADYKRTYYSMQKGFKTIRYPNFVIDRYLDRVADVITKIARDEYYKKNDFTTTRK